MQSALAPTLASPRVRQVALLIAVALVLIAAAVIFAPQLRADDLSSSAAVYPSMPAYYTDAGASLREASSAPPAAIGYRDAGAYSFGEPVSSPGSYRDAGAGRR